MTDSPQRKRDKAQAKVAKKQAKAQAKRLKKEAKARGADAPVDTNERPSAAVRFAEVVRGVLFLILSVSLIVAAVLANKGYIVKLEDVVDSLLLVWAGRVGVAVIATAFFIYGLKSLRAIR